VIIKGILTVSESELELGILGDLLGGILGDPAGLNIELGAFNFSIKKLEDNLSKILYI